MAKLGARDRAQLGVIAYQSGRIRAGDPGPQQRSRRPRQPERTSMTCPCVNSDRSSTGRRPSMASRILSRELNPATTGNDPSNFCTEGHPNRARCLTARQTPIDHTHDQPPAEHRG
ncbi:hypothetical protein Vau01_122230 [Virgisporangium aurantiacum]|uniref:Uncharacterized protein n=1 Tax=Virgisporangium aurantiacum TaxID=175570 RepID=A0A8J4EAE9_9ACTN|nr:hypothetical protein Vau01_122230 [Virgisporangium aurantiacum]